MASQKNLLDNLTPNQRIAVCVLILVIAGIAALVRARRERQHPPEHPQQPGDTRLHDNRNIRFGMPADAKHDPASKDAYLIERPQYVLSYNDAKKIPNWVCWNLNNQDIGDTPRPPFTEDPDLPTGFRRVTTGMYAGGGFDRGHLCPHKDRSNTPENNKPVFFMTNIMPQSPQSNQGAWERFEDFCRRLTRDGSELYIACGPDGQGGKGREGEKQTIGTSVKVHVPAASWKVVMVLPNKGATPSTSTRTLAVWVPNDDSVPEHWQGYAVSVATVEQRTGYKFFPAVPDDVANIIKTKVDRGP